MQFLIPSTTNKYAVTDLFHFAEEICQQEKERKLIKNKLANCNLCFYFQTRCKINNFFIFKKMISSFVHSRFAYKLVYYGKTKLHFKVRMFEHLGISVLTQKRVIDDDDFEDFFISNKDFKVILMDNLLINRDHPSLIQNQ